MKLLICATLTTPPRPKQTRGTIDLFRMTVEIEFTALMIATRDSTQDIKTDKGTFKVPLLTAIGENSLVGNSTDWLNPQEANSPEYVRNLLKQGWKPVKQNWIAAASEGYRFPEGVT